MSWFKISKHIKKAPLEVLFINYAFRTTCSFFAEFDFVVADACSHLISFGI